MEYNERNEETQCGSLVATLLSHSPSSTEVGMGENVMPKPKGSHVDLRII